MWVVGSKLNVHGYKSTREANGRLNYAIGSM